MTIISMLNYLHKAIDLKERLYILEMYMTKVHIGLNMLAEVWDLHSITRLNNVL